MNFHLAQIEKNIGFQCQVIYGSYAESGLGDLLLFYAPLQVALVFYNRQNLISPFDLLTLYPKRLPQDLTLVLLSDPEAAKLITTLKIL